MFAFTVSRVWDHPSSLLFNLHRYLQIIPPVSHQLSQRISRYLVQVHNRLCSHRCSLAANRAVSPRCSRPVSRHASRLGNVIVFEE